MTEKLKKQAEILRISDFGVVRARKNLCSSLHKVSAAADEKMYNPFLIMPEARSLIVCLFSYNRPQSGNISKYAMGSDYHAVIKQKLSEFVKPLDEGGFKSMIFSDSWDMDERNLALLAGLGFTGKNHMLISPVFGSFVFIGAVLTDCSLKEDKPLDMTCTGCGKCIKMCPGGALGEDGSFCKEKCVSHITQKKGELTPEEEEAVLRGRTIWGCDICQNVCPHNKNAPYSDIDEFSENIITNLKVDENMSNREFKRVYAGRAFTWRGIAPIVRNQKLLQKAEIMQK